jgi:hypothetical protein
MRAYYHLYVPELALYLQDNSEPPAIADEYSTASMGDAFQVVKSFAPPPARAPDIALIAILSVFMLENNGLLDL